MNKWASLLAILGSSLFGCMAVFAADSPQWGGDLGRNRVSAEKNLPADFEPGRKSPQGSGIDPTTTRNVSWTARLGSMTCSTPAIAAGRVFIGTAEGGLGHLKCFDEKTGQLLWQWSAPAREVPKQIDGRKMWFNVFPKTLGVCSTPAVDEDRVYIVNQRCEVVCLDARGGAPSTQPATQPSSPLNQSKVLWSFDMWDHGSRPSDACNGSVLIDGDFAYVATSNGIDRDADAGKKDEQRKAPAPDAPSLIVLDKRTGKLIAYDDEKIGARCFHGQWSSPSLGRVNGKTLIFHGGGDGVCYAFEAPAPSAADAPAQKLKLAWKFDCIPAEYKAAYNGMDPVEHYCRGDRRRSDAINKINDGSFVGASEIIATPVFLNNRVYIAIGRDPEHGRGRGALHCIDATGSGDITATGGIWTYQGLDRSLSTVSIADGLLYIADVAGRLHCLEADTGRALWVHEGKAVTWGSTLVADGKVYFPTEKSISILAAGREEKLLAKITLGAPVWASPVAANGAVYIASTRYLWRIAAQPSAAATTP